MATQRKYPDELRERAVKMVLEIRERDGKGHGRSPGWGGSSMFILRLCGSGTLTSTFLKGIRTAISVLGILAFTAVASLAFGPSGHALFLVWFGLASVAGTVFLLVFLGSGLWERQ